MCQESKQDFAEAQLLVGVSRWVTDMRAQILRVAPHARAVLISGPSGTGKELIARAIHAHSHRAHKPFIAVDCAAANGPLFASHLFGHRKGAFTGANESTLGCFRAADRGTIFLDEIGELDVEMQAKLLRVLQERTVVPLGGYEGVPVDVVVVAATNRNPQQMVTAGRFREDLYYRLNVVTLRTVALRERPEDVEPLTRHILAKLASRMLITAPRLSACCLTCLRKHTWPGNVRELENLLERALMLAPPAPALRDTPACAELSLCPAAAFDTSCNPAPETTECAAHEALSAATLCSPTLPSVGPASSGVWATLADLECAHIQRTLEHTKHNQQAAADLLGIHRQQLVRKAKKYGLDTSASRRGRPRKRDQF